MRQASILLHFLAARQPLNHEKRHLQIIELVQQVQLAYSGYMGGRGPAAYSGYMGGRGASCLQWVHGGKGAWVHGGGVQLLIAGTWGQGDLVAYSG